MKGQAVTLLLSAMMIFGGFGIVSAKVEDSIVRDFDVKPGGVLVLESDIGSVQVKAGSSEKVEVDIILKADTENSSRAKDIFDRFHVDFSQSGNRVSVEADYDQKRFSLFGGDRNRLQVEFYVHVPSQFDLEIHTGGGSIGVSDIEGTIDVETSGGSLNFSGSKGSITGRTSGGSISLLECEGEVDIKTSGGSISLEQVTGDVFARTSGGSVNLESVRGAVDASTSGGSVTAEIMEQPEKDCRLTTSGGSVTVHLPAAIKATVDARTSAGKIRSDFPLTVKGRYVSNELLGEINGGGPQIYLRTSAGNIVIDKL